MTLIIQKIKKIILISSNENRSCGRIICHCLTTLDINDINDYEIYKKSIRNL